MVKPRRKMLALGGLVLVPAVLLIVWFPFEMRSSHSVRRVEEMGGWVGDGSDLIGRPWEIGFDNELPRRSVEFSAE